MTHVHTELDHHLARIQTSFIPSEIVNLNLRWELWSCRYLGTRSFPVDIEYLHVCWLHHRINSSLSHRNYAIDHRKYDSRSHTWSLTKKLYIFQFLHHKCVSARFYNAILCLLKTCQHAVKLYYFIECSWGHPLQRTKNTYNEYYAYSKSFPNGLLVSIFLSTVIFIRQESLP
jgi:hypothetical protein